MFMSIWNIPASLSENFVDDILYKTGLESGDQLNVTRQSRGVRNNDFEKRYPSAPPRPVVSKSPSSSDLNRSEPADPLIPLDKVSTKPIAYGRKNPLKSILSGMDSRNRDRRQNSYTPPSSPLVGIETNPGPDAEKKEVKQLASQVKQTIKKAVKKKLKVKVPMGFAPKMSSAPLNTSFSLRRGKPSIVSGNGITRVTHTEYIKDLVANATANTYKGESFSLNCANPAVFPWLSTMAAMYGQFIPNRITFHYASLVSASTNGSVMIAVSPDCSDPVPGSKTALMQLNNVQRSNVWEHVDYEVPKAILTRLPKFVTSLADPQTDLDKSCGQLTFGSDDCSAALKYGEMYVSYDISFYDEQPPTYAAVKTLTVTNDSNVFPAGSTAISSSGMVALNAIDWNDGAQNNTLRVSKGGSFFFAIFRTAGTVVVANTVITTASIVNNFGVASFATVTNVGSAVNAAATEAVSIYLISHSSTAGSGGLTSPWFLVASPPSATTYTAKECYLFPYSIGNSHISLSSRTLNSLTAEVDSLRKLIEERDKERGQYVLVR